MLCNCEPLANSTMQGTWTVNSDHKSDTAPFSNDDYATGSLVEESYIAPHDEPAKPEDASSMFRSQKSIEEQLAFPYETLDVTSGQVPSLAASGTSLLSKPTEIEAMEFRVITAGSPTRRLRLTGNRYTFGSAHGCSIQLGDRSLRPMHAVLIRDASQILVRAYSIPIEINNVRTTEAKLSVGDVMRLGNYQFELLGSTKTSTQSISSDRFQNRSVTTSIASFDDRSASARDVASLGQLDSTIAAGVYPSSRPAQPTGMTPSPRRDFAPNVPMAEDAAWREQLRREVQQWRKRQEDCDRRESHCSQREHELRGRETELWSRAEDLYKRESRLLSDESNSRTIQTKYEQKKAEVARLTEENESHQRMLAKREVEFKGLEDNYRRQVEEAARQLTQSQEQAKAATDAIHRMREQFNNLNAQLETLSANQEVLTREEIQNREEHQRIQRELEESRNEAIEEREKSETRRAEAETRLAEVTRELDLIRDQRESEQRVVAESEVVAQQLRDQIEDLQQTVFRTSEESSELRNNYGEARETIQQLESLLSESGERHESDRSSWLAEAEHLHQSVEALSIELANAHRELSELRDVNNEVTHRIDEITKQRDQALAEVQVRPTSEAFDLVSAELGATTEQLSRMRTQYEEAIADLQDAFADRGALALDSPVRETPALDNPTLETPSSSTSNLSAFPAFNLGSSSPVGLTSLSELSGSDNDDQHANENGFASESELASEIIAEASSIEESTSYDAANPDDTDFKAGDEPNFVSQKDDGSAVLSEFADDNEAWPTYQTPSLHDQEEPAAPGEQAQWMVEEVADEAASEIVEPTFDSASEDVSEDVSEFAVDSTSQQSTSDENYGYESQAVFDENAGVDAAIQDSQSEHLQADNQTFEEEDVSISTWGTPSELLEDQDVQSHHSEEESDETPSVSWATPSQLLDEQATADEPELSHSYDNEDEDPNVSVSSWATPSQLLNEEATADEPELSHSHDEEDEDPNVSVSSWATPSQLLNEEATADEPVLSHSQDNEDEDPSVSVSSWKTPSQLLEEEANAEELALSHPHDDEHEDPSVSASSWASPSQLLDEEDVTPAESDVDDASIAMFRNDTEANSVSEHQWSADEVNGEASEDAGVLDDQHSADAEQDDPYGSLGSLASQLIQDIEAEKAESSPDQYDDVEATYHSSDEAGLNSPVEDTDEHSSLDLVHQDVADQDDAEVVDHTSAWSYADSQESGLEESSDDYSSERLDDLTAMDDAEDEAAATDEATVMSSDTVVGNGQEATGQEEDEDSIEAYMNRLLKRVQGESTQPSESGSTSSSSTKTSTSSSVTGSAITASAIGAAAATAAATEAGEPDFIDPDEPMVPRSQAPEKTSNLSAMRDLANQSARNAISRSTRVQTRDIQLKAMSKFAQTGVAILCAAAMIFFTTWSLRYIAAVAIVVIGFVCANEGFVLLVEAKKRLKSIEADAARDAEEAEPSEEELAAKAEMAAKLEAKLDLAVQTKKS